MADSKAAWVLETAGSLWAAKKIREYYSISNCLTIGEDFDISHPELAGFARKKGWLKKNDDFNFSKSYSDWFFTTFSASKTRKRSSENMIKSRLGEINFRHAFRILRDHGSEDYRPDSHFLGDRLCAHAANSLSRNATQTTGSIVAGMKDGQTVLWATGTSSPCTSIFKPVWFGPDVLPALKYPSDKYDPGSLWWHHELLHRGILLDYPTRIGMIAPGRDRLEDFFLKKAGSDAVGDRFALTLAAFKDAHKATCDWIEKIKAFPVLRKPGYVYRKYWEAQNMDAGINPGYLNSMESYVA
jgi:dipeptidase